MTANKFTAWPLELQVGSAAAPSLWFGDAGTGFYRSGANQISMTSAGVHSIQMSGGGLAVIRHASNPFCRFYRSEGTATTPTATTDGSNLGDFTAYGHNGTGYTPTAAFRFVQDGAVSGSYVPCKVSLYSRTNAGVLTECICARASGTTEIKLGLAHQGSTLGFFNTAPTTKPTVTGSRGGNAALASLLTALAGLGLLVNSSS